MGHKVDESTKQKIANTLKGRKPSKKAMQNMKKAGGARRGKVPYDMTEEISRKIANTLKGKFVGENAGAAKLNNQQVKEIRNKHILKECTPAQLAKEYKVSNITIYNIINYRCY